MQTLNLGAEISAHNYAQAPKPLTAYRYYVYASVNKR